MLFENDDVKIYNIMESTMVKELEKQYGMKAVKAFKYCNTTYGVNSISIELTEITDKKYCEQVKITITDDKKEVRRVNWINPYYKEKLTSLEDI